MNTRIDEIPRSIKFNQNSIKNFVKGSSFLNATSLTAQQNYYPQNKIISAKTYNNIPVTVVGFDFYNKNNLLLKVCNSEDIQYIQKNPIIYQEDVIVFHDKIKWNKNIEAQKNLKTQSRNKAKTMKDFYKKNEPNIQEREQKKSKQAELNQFLFNYRKQQQQKKNKRLKFLSEVEQKINKMQREAAQIQSQKIKQYQQLNGIIKISNETSQFARRNDMLGKVNTALNQFQQQRTVLTSPPKKISQEMELLQINLAIEQQHQYNDALLDQIQRVSRSKSKERLKANDSRKLDKSPKKTSIKKQNESIQNNTMSKTLKRPIQAPPRPVSGAKKLTSTWKDKK